MALIVSCPYCGQRLCKAEEGSKIVMQCPKCREDLDLVVAEQTVRVGKTKRNKHQAI